jgi:CRISPR-associated protein Csa1
MYWPSDNDRKRLIKELLPESRTLRVDDHLRGWHWYEAPMKPPFDVLLANYEVASRYCPTGRDLYLRRVQRVSVKPNEAMVQGAALHALVARFIQTARRLLYVHGVAAWDQAVVALEGLNPEGLMRARLDSVEIGSELAIQVRTIWEYLLAQTRARIQDALAAQPHLDEDGLVQAVLPFSVEQRLDGSLLGLSRQLSCDALRAVETVILDLKFGDRRDFHRQATTGYALVLESLHEYPVNVGCVVYVRFIGRQMSLERDYHLIDEELRQWFIEARDERMRMIFDELDPGLPQQCYRSCPYLKVCHGEEQATILAAMLPEKAR